MTKKEFEALTNRADKMIHETYVCVCYALFNCEPRYNGSYRIFQTIFCPKGKDFGDYYFGRPGERKNMDERSLALRLFEQYVIDEKLYEVW